MSNFMKVTLIFAAVAGILVALYVIIANWSGNEEVLPPALQDPVKSEATK